MRLAAQYLDGDLQALPQPLVHAGEASLRDELAGFERAQVLVVVEQLHMVLVGHLVAQLGLQASDQWCNLSK